MIKFIFVSFIFYIFFILVFTVSGGNILIENASILDGRIASFVFFTTAFISSIHITEIIRRNEKYGT